MSTMAPALTTQVYSVFIRASAEQIWDAITKPEFTRKYFYGASVTVTAARFDGGGTAAGSVETFDPPHRLVHEWRSLYDPELAAEPSSRVSWEIEEREGGVCLLTVVHDRLEGAPKTAESVSGPGWMRVLSGLKTLLETGEPLFG